MAVFLSGTPDQDGTKSHARPDEPASYDPEDLPQTAMVFGSVRPQAADFEQLKPEGLDLGEHAVQRGLVRQRSREYGVLSAPLSPQGGERGAHRLAQATAHADHVLPRLRPIESAGHVVAIHKTEPGHRRDERPTHDSDDF